MQTTGGVGIIGATAGGCTIWQSPVDKDLVSAIDIGSSDQRLVQSLVGTVADNGVKIGLVTVVVAATFLIHGAKTLHGLGLILVRGTVVEVVRVGVWVMVCTEQPVATPESQSRTEE